MMNPRMRVEGLALGGLSAIRWMLLAATLLAGGNLLAAQDIVVADFEGKDYGDWKVTGEAFGVGPAHGTLPGQMQVSGFKGQGLVNTYFRGDGSTGTLTSPEFKIERKYLRFLVGGGKDAEKTCVHLLINGKICRTATGPNDQPGGSEELIAEFWDVSEFLGQPAVIQIVDKATGGWGHINVDEIVQTDAKPPGLILQARRELSITHRYLNFPIKNGGPKRQLTAAVDGSILEQNTVELADDQPDWWAFMDVSAWIGKTMAIEVDKLPEDSKALSSIEQSDSIKDAKSLYRESLRGQFHFSSRRGWNNDPNGLVYFHGEYHLFYQHNPYGWGWGNMHWGHAVSRDLVHWEELGDVLAPDELGPMFSGSAVVDWNNSSGLGEPGKPPLILIYTAAGNPTVQCLASSTDGRHFKKFNGNPVLNEISDGNRDPKVIWHEPTQQWVMVLYVARPEKKHTVHFFTSPNLRDWKMASIAEGGADQDHFLYECPDFFALPVDADTANLKWVLTAADSEYAVGSFDGNQFTPERTKLPGQRGRGFYAAQAFSDIPASDGRRIQIGWFQTETKGMPFNQSMTMPLELRLITTAEGPRLTWNPIRELESLRASSTRLGPVILKPGDVNPLAQVHGELLEIRAEFEPVGNSQVKFVVRGVDVEYDAVARELIVNGHRAPAPLRNGRQRLAIFADRTGLEVFASDGLTYVPMPIILEAKNLRTGVSVTGASLAFHKLEAHVLRSIWK